MIRCLALVLLFCVVGSSRGLSADLPLLTAEVSPATQVVQGPATYTATVIRVPGIHNGYFFAPDFGEAIVVDLGRGEPESVSVSGDAAEMTVHRYALFPQTPGQLAIPPATFSGPDISVRSESSTVEVVAAPVDAADWFPAATVTVVQDWGTGAVRAGYPIVRTVEVAAVGVTGAQIPPLKIGSSNSFRAIRRDVAVETKPSGSTVTGRRIETLHYLPTAEGPLSIPPIAVRWWKDGGTEPTQSSVPGRTFPVAAAPQVETAQAPVPQSPPVGRPAEPLETPPDRPWWVLLAAAFAIVLAGQFVRTRQHVWTASFVLRRACHRGDADAIKSALLRWGRARFPETPPPPPGGLAEFR